MEAVLVIPARYGSTRLPGKPLADIDGKPLIARVLEQALQASRFSDVVVATDDVRIADVVEKAGGRAMMTRSEHNSGTDRVAEVVEELNADIIVNLQGDEPFINPLDLDNVAEALARDGAAEMATLRQPIMDERDYIDPNVVKVVADDRGYALYFSRAPIPYHRSGTFQGAFRHVGVYAFRRHFLLSFAANERSTLEVREGLEQLRALSMGAKIRLVEAQSRSIGVDTPEDLERARHVSASMKSGSEMQGAVAQHQAG